MSTYYTSKKHTVLLPLVFIAGSLVGLIMLPKQPLLGVVLTTSSIICAFVFSIAKFTVVTTDDYIKRTISDNQKFRNWKWVGKLDEFVRSIMKKDEACNWEWVYAITTERSKVTGDYHTVLHWSKLNPHQLKEYLAGSNKCNENVGKMIVTSHISRYPQLLKEIVDRSANARVDETTTKLMQ